MTDALSRAAALTQILESSSGNLSKQHMAEALISCCEDLIDCGEASVALELLRCSSNLEEGFNNEWAVRIESVRARALSRKGDFVESIKCIRALFSSQAELLATIPHEAHRLRICEAGCLWRLQRADEAVERLIRIRSELLNQPDSDLLALCSLNLCSAQMLCGDYGSARKFALEAIVSSTRCNNRGVEAMAQASLGRLERMNCRWSTASEASQSALKVFEQLGKRIESNRCRRGLGIIAWKRGRLSEAYAVADQCIAEAAAMGSVLLERYAYLFKGVIQVHQGAYGEARRLLTSDIVANVPAPDARTELLVDEFLGDIHLEQGEAEPALRHYDEVWPKALALVPKGDIVAELRRRRAECYYLLGRRDEAYSEAKLGLEHCRELGDRYEEAATYRVLGLSAAAVGKPAEARKWFEQGFAYYDDIETPYEWGKLWMSYGDWLSGTESEQYRDVRGAVEAYQAARDHFERMGARAKLAEAQARLAALAPTLSPSIAVRDAPVGPAKGHRPQRRPRGAAELERRSQWARETFHLITMHPPLLRLLDDVAKLARSNAPVLVLGESGTGKELIAQGLHRLSGRRGAFVPINCSTLPREVIESELFGHTSGAFTGATKDRAGLMESSDQGTVFLDEIADMSLDLQARLLRFLEAGESRRVGSNRATVVDTRVVAATNRERGALERGEGLRVDLFYRLAHAVVTLPPLRRRGGDSELLVRHFLAQACIETKKQVRLSATAWERLRDYGWPGNVRQLASAIRRVVLLAEADEEIEASALELDPGDVATTLLEELEHTERQRVAEALHEARGSRSEAARALGIPRTTLINKLRRYGLG
jgi:transcriptional regulator with AAA-type ATPase domain